MAMSGNTLGTAIGTAFYNAIPASVKDDMTADARTAMCNSLVANSKIIANCVIAHIVANADITVATGIAVQAGSCTGSTTSTGTATIA